MANKFLYITFLLFSLLPDNETSAQKFIPPDGKKLLILGQDMGAVGGFESPNNSGYTDFFPGIPAGITTYTSLSNLGGLKTLDNWGSGDVCAQCILDNPRYNNSCIIIGLYIVNQLDDIVSGILDSRITELGKWIQDAKRPVFLRIGYEFNGSWNNYNPEKYKAAYQQICDVLNLMGVTNYATVWQSEGSGTANQLSAWYPGDNYVDWMGYSHFANKGSGIIELAKQKSKPVMIAEAAPQKDLKKENGSLIWTNWFLPLFKHISDNNVIKALAYINVDWESQSMWEGQGWGDSRIQENPIITDNWNTEINSGTWLLGDEDLFSRLLIFPQNSINREKKDLRFSVSRELNTIRVNPPIVFSGRFGIEIISVTGSVIITRDFNSNEIQSFEFPFNQGLYLVKIYTGSEISIHKFLWL